MPLLLMMYASGCMGADMYIFMREWNVTRTGQIPVCMDYEGEWKRKCKLAWKSREFANASMCRLHGVVLSMQCSIFLKTFLLPIWVPQGAAMLACSLPVKNRKAFWRLRCVIFSPLMTPLFMRSLAIFDEPDQKKKKGVSKVKICCV